MTTQLPPLTWQPYQAGRAGTLVAVVNLDSGTDTSFSVPISGVYNTGGSNVATADQVVVFNTDNNGTVTLVAGPISIPVPPYTRDFLQLSQSTALNLGVQFTVGTLQLQFYKGTPPLNPSLYNYAGAIAVSNSVVFNGPITMGTANTQTISVAAIYSFTTGIMVTGTAGFTNTGPATMSVNGGPGIAITKITEFGSVPLTGGELIADSNFILSANGVTGTFDLISDFPNASPIEANLGGDVPITNTVAYFPGPSIAQGNNGTWSVKANVTIVAGGAGPEVFYAKLWDGATIIASGAFYLPAAGQSGMLSLAGIIVNPVGNLRCDVRNASAAEGFIAWNVTGLGKDSTISAIRVN